MFVCSYVKEGPLLFGPPPLGLPPTGLPPFGRHWGLNSWIKSSKYWNKQIRNCDIYRAVGIIWNLVPRCIQSNWFANVISRSIYWLMFVCSTVKEGPLLLGPPSTELLPFRLHLFRLWGCLDYGYLNWKSMHESYYPEVSFFQKVRRCPLKINYLKPGTNVSAVGLILNRISRSFYISYFVCYTQAVKEYVCPSWESFLFQC